MVAIGEPGEPGKQEEPGEPKQPGEQHSTYGDTYMYITTIETHEDKNVTMLPCPSDD